MATWVRRSRVFGTGSRRSRGPCIASPGEPRLGLGLGRAFEVGVEGAFAFEGVVEGEGVGAFAFEGVVEGGVCAWINRQRGENERVSHRRSSDPR